MKTAILSLIVSMIVCGYSWANEPRLTAAEVREVGSIIFNADNHKKYEDGFLLKEPTFDPKKKIWRFQSTGKPAPVFPGSPLYFFEIRDEDGYYRIGSISGRGFNPKSAENFRMSPALRAKIAAVSEN